MSSLSSRLCSPSRPSSSPVPSPCLLPTDPPFPPSPCPCFPHRLSLSDSRLKYDPDRVYRKADTPKLCWSTDRTKRADARIAYRQRNTHDLRAQGRELTSTLRRDDGVGYSWRKTDHVLAAASSSKTALNRHDSIPPTNGLDRENPEGKRRSSPKDSVIFVVPWPTKFAAQELRRAADDEFDKWQVEQWAMAAELDADGRSTRHIFLRDETPGLSVESRPLSEGSVGRTAAEQSQMIAEANIRRRTRAANDDNVQHNPRDAFDGQIIVPYPRQFASKRSRTKDAFDRWRREQALAAETDFSGPGKVTTIMGSTDLFIRWKATSKTSRSADGHRRPGSIDLVPQPQATSCTFDSASSSSQAIHMKRDRPPHEPREQVPHASLPLTSSSGQQRPQSPAHQSSLNPQPPKRPRVDLPASALAESSERKSVRLRELQQAMQAKLTAIDNWTGILADYPERADTVGKQVERMQAEIFQLRGAIRLEKERPRAAE